jgi:hypothetical protein
MDATIVHSAQNVYGFVLQRDASSAIRFLAAASASIVLSLM